MNIYNFNNPQQNIAILGFGVSGYALATFLLKKGNPFTIFDDKGEENLFYQKLKAETGKDFPLAKLNDYQALTGFDLYVAAPGIAIHDGRKNPALVRLQEEGQTIIGDIELFAQIKAQTDNPALAKAKVIGITGSNGKTTTTNLVAHLLGALRGKDKVCMAGNVGEAILNPKHLEGGYEYYVLELSSFQLETTYSLDLDAATILNVSPDHLDRYDNNLESYTLAKQHIYELAKVAIYNLKDPLTKPFLKDKKLSPYLLPKDKEAILTKNLTSISFASLDEQADYFSDGEIIGFDFLSSPFRSNLLSYCQLRGTHNFENILAAFALVIETLKDEDFDEKDLMNMLLALKGFHSLPHRYQGISLDYPQDFSKAKVNFINDSKATNIGATISALRSTILPSANKIFLLLGGEGKGQDFNELSPYLASNSIKAYCFGRDGVKIASTCPNCILVGNEEATMKEALEMIYKDRDLKDGDLILLSPACASLDQFKNYEVRGMQFIELALSYAQS